jgi:hypothetical protein
MRTSFSISESSTLASAIIDIVPRHEQDIADRPRMLQGGLRGRELS